MLRLAIATVGLGSVVGCSDRFTRGAGERGERVDLRGTRAFPNTGDPHAGGKAGPSIDTGVTPPTLDARVIPPANDARVTVPMCRNPTLGSVGSLSFVSLTGTAVDKCIAGDTSHCSSSSFVDANDIALDYGDFPFSRQTARTYFYAVVAAGHEEAGFFQGAAGNLSDDVPSAVAGDLGSGDTLADRTIVVGDGQVPLLFPESRGTHAFSFPPSQFMTIHLAPFDTTPEGQYVLVLCPITAASRCDCAFDAFMIEPLPADGGGAHDAGVPDAHAEGGAGHDAMCPDM